MFYACPSAESGEIPAHARQMLKKLSFPPAQNRCSMQPLHTATVLPASGKKATILLFFRGTNNRHMNRRQRAMVLRKLSKHLIQQLREASRIFVREQGVLRAETTRTSLSYAQGHTMIELDRHAPLTVVKLAEILNLNKSSTSRTLMKLQRKGWVTVQIDERDSRCKLFSLTPQGQAELRKLNQEVDNRVEDALRLLSDKDCMTVLSGLQLYAAALQRARRQNSSDD